MQGSGSLLQCDHNGLQMQLGLPPNATAKNTDINSYTNTNTNTGQPFDTNADTNTGANTGPNAKNTWTV